MTQKGKKLTALLLALSIVISVAAVSLVNASAKVNENGTYDPAGRDTNTYMFAMPGYWESDYWKTNENIAGIYWWTGSDVPKDNLAHEWPGYAVARVEQDPVAVAGQTPVEIKNLYSTPVPKDTRMIIFNNHINGGMPSEPDFDQKKFDAAKQIKDTVATYTYIGYDDYQYKDLWIIAYNAFCDQLGYPRVKWDTTTNEVTKAEKAMIKAIFGPSNKIKDNEKKLCADAGFDMPENPVYDREDEEDFDPNDFVIEEFGDYAFNFFVDMENGNGLVQNFDNMVYVCNLEPNSMIISTTIVPEGMPAFGGDFFFYYGNGEYGVYPTKDLCIEKLGITFDQEGKAVAPAGLSVDTYGNVVKPAPGLGFEGKDTTMMVYGNFTGDYYEKNRPVEIPTSSTIDSAQPTVNPTQPTWVPPEGAENKVYFKVDRSIWRNFKNITCYIGPHNGGDAPFSWGSKKGLCEEEGDGLYSYDFDEKGITIESGKQYSLNFTGDWGISTCDMLFDASLMGGTCVLTAEQCENNVDSNKRSYVCYWEGQDQTKYGPVKCITSIGNVIGTAYWYDVTPYDMLLNFIKSNGKDGLQNALNFNGKTAQQTLDDTAKALGLTTEDIARAIEESGKHVDWSDGNSSGKYDIITNTGFKFTKLEDGTYMLSDYDNPAKSHIKIPSTVHALVDSSERVGSAEPVSAWEEPTVLPTTEPAPVTVPAPKYEDVPVTAIGDWVFANNKYVETVEIPDSIKTIGQGVFYNCVRLKGVEVPDSVTALGASIFEKCLNLEEVTLGKNLTSIGDEAFYDCRRLKKLDIPDSVKTIGEEAFTNCRSLTSLNIPDGVGALGSEDSVGCGMFENCKSLREITVPASVAYIQKNAFDGCDNVTILGEQNSYAQDFAAEHHILFKMIDADECMVGDVSGDGNVDITDATIVQQFAAEKLVPTAAQKTAADTNHDGNVDITDATLIQMYAAEIIHSF